MRRPIFCVIPQLAEGPPGRALVKTWNPPPSFQFCIASFRWRPSRATKWGTRS